MNNKPEEYTSPIIKEVLKQTSETEAQKIKKRMLLAKKIENALKAKGWNKGEFAKNLNKQASVISKWLSGTHNFTHDTLCDIERLLEINLINVDDTNKEQVIVYRVEIKSQNKTDIIDDYTSLLIDSPVITQSFTQGFEC